VLTLSHSEGTVPGCFGSLDQPIPSCTFHLYSTSNWSDQKSPALPAGNW